MPAASIRDARDSDSAALIELITAVFAEYPGCVMDVDGEMPHLRRPASAFRDWEGRLWVAEEDRAVVACCGFADAPPAVELKNLYVGASARRQGLGARFCELVEAEARRLGRVRVSLWSDTRFTDAHRLYERLGYERGPETRVLHDLSHSVEYFYSRPIS